MLEIGLRGVRCGDILGIIVKEEGRYNARNRAFTRFRLISVIGDCRVYDWIGRNKGNNLLYQFGGLGYKGFAGGVRSREVLHNRALLRIELPNIGQVYGVPMAELFSLCYSIRLMLL